MGMVPLHIQLGTGMSKVKQHTTAEKMAGLKHTEEKLNTRVGLYKKLSSRLLFESDVESIDAPKKRSIKESSLSPGVSGPSLATKSSKPALLQPIDNTPSRNTSLQLLGSHMELSTQQPKDLKIAKEKRSTWKPISE